MEESSVQIIPYYAHPHVHVVIEDNTWYDETVASRDPEDLPFATVVVAGADQGIDNTFVRVSDLDTKINIFGKGNFAKYGQASLQADLLFNGSTNVWFCRVLPDNATYANMIVLAHYREADIKDDNEQPTGLKCLEVKFTTSYIDDKKVVGGATNDEIIIEAANMTAQYNNDPAEGFTTVPIWYVRSTGRGDYGNEYAISFSRDPDAEKEYGMKMFKWSLVSNSGGVTRVTNIFSGSMYQTTRYNVSTLISDVLDQYSTGSCPIYIYPFQDNFQAIYDAYADVVAQNAEYLNATATATAEQLDELEAAQDISVSDFDPFFGYVLRTRSDEIIPYYTNLTKASVGPNVGADKTVALEKDKPLTVDDWPSVKAGSTVKVLNSGGRAPILLPNTVKMDMVQRIAKELREIYGDEETANYVTQVGTLINMIQNTNSENGEGQIEKGLKDQYRKEFGKDWNPVGTTVVPRQKKIPPMLYTVITVKDNGEIVYDLGVEVALESDAYDGVDLSASGGIVLAGGTDGDFSTISVNGVDRAPTAPEMKLLLAREEVKAFKGEKDRKILSPARTNVDFIFDANYNMTTEGALVADTDVKDVYYNSTVLTDSDYKELEVLGKDDIMQFIDINVKQAMYDLVEFRNRNGMTIAEDMGAGCSLYLDCGLVGIKNVNSSMELMETMSMFQDMTGRATSIDLGSYDVYDPYTGKRISVTATYFLAEKLVPHLMAYGLNKPFTYRYAQLQAYQRTASLTSSNAMIRDSFKPDIDLIDWDVKETLFTNRFNYYLTRDEGRLVERACQNTRQLEASALLEENNVRVLNTLKKGLEAACRGYLYEWNEPEARKGYTDAQMAIYRPWIGTMVQDIEIKFDANAFEQERCIMHCYCVVKFRDIVKRIILEINIQRPEY